MQRFPRAIQQVCAVSTAADRRGREHRVVAGLRRARANLGLQSPHFRRVRAALVVGATRIVQERRVLSFDRQHDAIDEAQQAFDDLVHRIVIGSLDGFAHGGSLRPRTGGRAGPAPPRCVGDPRSRTGRGADRARAASSSVASTSSTSDSIPSPGPASARRPPALRARRDTRAGSAKRARTARTRVVRPSAPGGALIRRQYQRRNSGMVRGLRPDFIQRSIRRRLAIAQPGQDLAHQLLRASRSGRSACGRWFSALSPAAAATDRRCRGS